MLVLSRKQGESIHVGDHIKITVVEVRGGRIRLGIEAPDDVEVLRSELYEVIRLPWRQTPSDESGPNPPHEPQTDCV